MPQIGAKKCSTCKIEKPYKAFHKNISRSDGVSSDCKECKKEYRLRESVRAREKDRYEKLKLEGPDRIARRWRKHSLVRMYGSSLEEYESLLEKQGGVCVICGRPETRKGKKNLSVDHDHETGVVRGLLCCDCNVALGLLEEDTNRMLALMSYVVKHKKGVA